MRIPISKGNAGAAVKWKRSPGCGGNKKPAAAKGAYYRGWYGYGFIKPKDHVLLPFADRLEEVDIEFRQILTSDKIREIVNAIPDDWLNWTEGTETPQDLRDIYIRFLEERMKHSETFVNEAQNARKALI